MIGLLRSPSAYEKEPGKYLPNQIGHTYLVGFAPVFVCGWQAIPLIAMLLAAAIPHFVLVAAGVQWRRANVAWTEKGRME